MEDERHGQPEQPAELRGRLRLAPTGEKADAPGGLGLTGAGEPEASPPPRPESLTAAFAAREAPPLATSSALAVEAPEREHGAGLRHAPLPTSAPPSLKAADDPEATSQRFASEGWQIAVPAGMRGQSVVPPPGCSGFTILRGELAPDVQARVIVSTRSRLEISLAGLARRLQGALLDPVERCPATLAGARAALRLGGLAAIPGGLDAQGLERIDALLVGGEREILALLVRTGRGRADAAQQVERLLGSLVLGQL